MPCAPASPSSNCPPIPIAPTVATAGPSPAMLITRCSAARGRHEGGRSTPGDRRPRLRIAGCHRPHASGGDTLCGGGVAAHAAVCQAGERQPRRLRSEEHTSELQSPKDLVCRLLLEK